MNIEIKKIKLQELESFVQSDAYRIMETVPITPLRALSYINNPHGRANDTVILLGFYNKRMIAFRTLFAGEINSTGNRTRFGWCSGSWVDPEFRRQGFSKLLLREAYKDWNGKLMFTNYAPDSEKLYLKTGWFKPVHQFKGIRAYLFPKFRKLLPMARRNRLFHGTAWLLDIILYAAVSIRLLFYSGKSSPEYRFETVDHPDEQCMEFWENEKNAGSLRHMKELEWIFKYPWLSTSDKSYCNKYPFSSFADSFFYKTIKIFGPQEFSGFFIFSVREGHLKTLFLACREGAPKEIARYLKDYCIRVRIEKVTIYNTDVSNPILSEKFPFLRVRKYGQKIYSTFEINKVDELHFQDGEGDAIFS